jgi:hypothetical protein
MKKLAIFATTSAFLINAASTFAQSAGPLSVKVGAPALGINPSTSIGGLITNALTIIFIAAVLLVLFFIVMGAFQWITSGGDKEKVGNARKTIIAALVGLALLALAFLIVRVVGSVLNIDILNLPNLPRLGPASSGVPCPNGAATDGTCL